MARNSKSRTAKRGAAKVRAKKTARSTPDKSTLPISKDMNTSETHNAPDQTNILLERYGLGDTPTAQLRRKILDGYEAWPIEARGHFGAKRFKKPLGEEVESREVAASLRRRLGLHSVLLGEIDEKAGTMTVEGGHGSECYCCEAEVSFELDVNKERITATTECSQPDGFPPYKVRVNVPSGKLVFANDLREFIGINDSYNVNAVGGRIRTTQAYAAHDMVHISVGNTCPSIYQKGNTITMVTTKEDVKRKPGEGDYGKRRGGICTDLWWFCAIDYEVLRQKVNDDKKFERVVSDHYSTIVTVEPGMYEATSFEHLVRDESASYSLYSAIWGLEDKLAGRDRHDASKKFPKPSKAEAKQIKAEIADYKQRQHDLWHANRYTVYATIERVGECGEITDHAAIRKQFAAPGYEEAIACSAMGYPSIYPTRVAVVDHTFFSYGNGLNWQDGALYSICDDFAKARERYAKGARPKFLTDAEANEPHPYVPGAKRAARDSHYPTCGYSAIFTVPSDVRLDWLKGAYEAVRLLLSLDHTKKSSTGHENSNNIANGRVAMRLLDMRFGGVNYLIASLLQAFPDRIKTREQALVFLLCDSGHGWEWLGEDESTDNRAGSPGGPSLHTLRAKSQTRGAFEDHGPSLRRAMRIAAGEPVAWNGPVPKNDYEGIKFTESSLAFAVPENVESNWLLACVEALESLLSDGSLPKTIARRAQAARERLELRLVTERAKQVFTPKTKKKQYAGDAPQDDDSISDNNFEDRKTVVTIGDLKRMVDARYEEAIAPLRAKRGHS